MPRVMRQHHPVDAAAELTELYARLVELFIIHAVDVRDRNLNDLSIKLSIGLSRLGQDPRGCAADENRSIYRQGICFALQSLLTLF